jgi:hypothetical protein
MSRSAGVRLSRPSQPPTIAISKWLCEHERDLHHAQTGRNETSSIHGAWDGYGE